MPSDVRAAGGLKQVQPVGYGADRKCGGKQQRRTPDCRAADGERADEEGEQDDVAGRVRKVRHNGGAAAAGRVEHDLHEDCGSHRSRRQPSRHAVEPHGSGRPQAAAHEQEEACVDKGEVGEVADVGKGGERRLSEVGERDEPVDVACSPDNQPCCHQRPGQSVLAHDHRSKRAEPDGGEQQTVVEAVVEERLDRSAVVDQRVHGKCGQARERGKRERNHDEPPQPFHELKIGLRPRNLSAGPARGDADERDSTPRRASGHDWGTTL